MVPLPPEQLPPPPLLQPPPRLEVQRPVTLLLLQLLVQEMHRLLTTDPAARVFTRKALQFQSKQWKSVNAWHVLHGYVVTIIGCTLQGEEGEQNVI